MWNAELKLRTFKPEDALPFEYKALRLLKDLQQKSRVYVQKTAIKISPVKEEKRLTGELNKIISPSTQKTIASGNDVEKILRKGMALMEVLKISAADDASSKQLLREMSC